MARTSLFVSAAAVSVGCVELESTPPELLEARFGPVVGDVRPNEITLTFSEAIGSIADVDPEHFRISTTLVIDDEGSDLTVYYDLANHFVDGLPGVDEPLPDFDGPQPFHAFTIVAAIRRGEAPNELVLELSYPIEVPVCDALDLAAELDIPAGIFVHYAQDSYPRIIDQAGNELADIAPQWVEEPTGLLTTPGSFPWVDSSLAIPCP